MGDPCVLGIAESRGDDSEIVFLLSGNSTQLENSIKIWAIDHHVRARVRVVGDFQLLKTG
jgi:hypothetical protein